MFKSPGNIIVFQAIKSTNSNVSRRALFNKKIKGFKGIKGEYPNFTTVKKT